MFKISATFASLATAAMLLAAGPANAVIIGFEGVATPSTPGGGAPHAEAGFTLTSNAPESLIFPPGFGPINTNGTDVFAWCGGCGATPQVLSLAADGGSLFSFLSFEATNMVAFSFIPGMAIDVTGHLGAGGTVSQTFSLIENTFTTFTLDAAFTGLSSVDITSLSFPAPNFVIDNLEVVASGASIISEPASLALFGVGLAGIGYLRRKRMK